MAYWHVQGGYYPEISGGVNNLEDMLFYCDTVWYLTEEELNEVRADWLECHPDNVESDDSLDSDYIEEEEESSESDVTINSDDN